MTLVRKMVARAAMGSTMPEAVPYHRALGFDRPEDLRGMEMMAPSGMFCSAMPMDSARAEAMEMPGSPMARPA